MTTLDQNLPLGESPDDLLDRDQFSKLIGNPSAATFYRWLKQGRIPRPIEISPGFKRWLRRDAIDLRNKLISDRARKIAVTQ